MFSWPHPGNIWSGERYLAVLTNPTEIARWKGNLRYSYPIVYHGHQYRDVEDAYQHNKPRSMQERMALLSELIAIKFQTYPDIHNAVTRSGGVKFLRNCSHFLRPVNLSVPNPKKSIWEGKGVESPFIQCLVRGYITL